MYVDYKEIDGTYLPPPPSHFSFLILGQLKLEWNLRWMDSDFPLNGLLKSIP